MIKQKTPYGCGLIAVANALNLPDFVSDHRMELSELYGNTIGQLSMWLQDAGHNYAIDAFYYDHEGSELPDHILAYKPADRETLLPILLNVQFSEEGKRHLVAGHIDHLGAVYLQDSLADEPQLTTLAKINKNYCKVFGLFVFMDALTGDYVFYK